MRQEFQIKLSEAGEACLLVELEGFYVCEVDSQVD
jgi:hypothetical protein